LDRTYVEFLKTPSGSLALVNAGDFGTKESPELMKSSSRALRRSGFTLIELLVVVAIIAIIASLLFPAIGRAKDKGKTTKCASNLRQLGLAVTMYEQDQKYYPAAWPPPLWYTQLQPYVGKSATNVGRGVFICPSSFQKNANGRGTHEGGVSGFLCYAQNAQINSGITTMNSSSIADLEGTIFYADTDGWDAALYPDGTPGNVCYRHSGGNERSAEMERGVSGQKGAKRRANAVFVAGQVELIKKAPARLFTPARD
jgi:prepilin-type N-terminal cleavage/methylation domain-containing protein